MIIDFLQQAMGQKSLVEQGLQAVFRCHLIRWLNKIVLCHMQEWCSIAIEAQLLADGGHQANGTGNAFNVTGDKSDKRRCRVVVG